MKGTKSNFASNLSVRPVLIGAGISLLCILIGLGIMVVLINSSNPSLMYSQYAVSILQGISVMIGSLISGVIGRKNLIGNCIASAILVIVLETFVGCIFLDSFPTKILWQCFAGVFGTSISVGILIRSAKTGRRKRSRRTRLFVQNTQRGK